MTLEDCYGRRFDAGHPMSHHMPYLRELASSCDTAVEFGVNAACSTVAILLGVRKRLTSYDYRRTPSVDEIGPLAGDLWEFINADTRNIPPIPVCDMLLVDSLHTYEQVDAELRRHAGSVRRYLVFHDTITFGSVGADNEKGRAVEGVMGIRPAIDDLMIRDRSWRIVRHDVRSHGLLTIERVL